MSGGGGRGKGGVWKGAAVGSHQQQATHSPPPPPSPTPLLLQQEGQNHRSLAIKHPTGDLGESKLFGTPVSGLIRYQGKGAQGWYLILKEKDNLKRERKDKRLVP